MLERGKLERCSLCIVELLSRSRRRSREAGRRTAASSRAGRLSRGGTLHTHTHTHPFNGPFSGTTRVSRYQKGKTNLVFTEAIRDSEWQWHQLGHMQVCTSLQTDNHASTPTTQVFFTGQMPFLPPNQQRQALKAMEVGPTLHIMIIFIHQSTGCSW